MLKKREEFAISLRKKKHSEMIESKRKLNTQKAFERTIMASSTIQGQEMIGDNCERLDIKDEHTLA